MGAQVSVTVACTISGLPAEDGPFLNDLVWRFFKREEGHDGATDAGLAAMGEMLPAMSVSVMLVILMACFSWLTVSVQREIGRASCRERV